MVLTSQQAVRLARDYITARQSKLLPGVAARAVALSLSSGDTADDLILRLKAATLVVAEIEIHLSPGASEDAAWVRHDPEAVLRDGLNSSHYANIDRDGLVNAAIVYLDQDWLSSPIIDWMIVDALVTSTLIEYGENAKKYYILDVVDRTLYFNTLYRDTCGNLTEMMRVAQSGRRDVVMFSLFGVVTPAIFGPFALTEYKAFAVVGAVLYPMLALPYMSYKFINNRRRKLEQLKAFNASLEEWRSMHEIWKLLEGPVLDPERIATALTAKARDGVAFDHVVYRIVERVVATRRSWSISLNSIKFRF